MKFQPPNIKKLNDSLSVFGTKVSAVNYQLVIEQITNWITSGKTKVICVAAVHLVMETYHNTNLQIGVNQTAIVTPDGAPLYWLLKYFGFNHVERVYGPELTIKVCQIANENNWKIYFLGGSKGQSKLVVKNLKQKFPKLKVAGSTDTPIRPLSKEKNKRIIEDINKSQANIVFIGLGCPLQEKWMIDNQQEFKASILIGVGAAFDFISGKVFQAPRWMQNIGLEWLFRLIQDPTRLWRRYLVFNAQFIGLLLIALVRNKLSSKNFLNKII